MKRVKIILTGCGSVGRAFLNLVKERSKEIEKKYKLNLIVKAVVDLNGAAVADSDDGLPLAELADYLDQGKEVQTFPQFGKDKISGCKVMDMLDADVLIEATPTDLVDGGAAKEHVFKAIDRGMEIVSANKGPFVLFYRQVFEKAEQKGCGLHISAATAAALPTLDVGLICLAGTGIISFKGILNGTTNYILSEMRNKGTSYEDALAQAQKLGIAETDPGYDVEGKDTANKIILIASQVFGKSFGLSDITIKGITQVTINDIKEAEKKSRVIKLIGTAETINGELVLNVEPKLLNMDHPLASIDGSQKAITYETDTMGSITVLGGKSSPVGAGAALLKDLINAFR